MENIEDEIEYIISEMRESSKKPDTKPSTENIKARKEGVMETVNDILREMFECANAVDLSIFEDERIAGLVRNAKSEQLKYVDRIKEAYKREIDTLTADRDNWRQQALEEDARANATTEKSLQVGNALNTNPAENVNSEKVIYNGAKMLETLGDVHDTLEKLQPYSLQINDISLRRAFRSRLCCAKNVIDAALAAPPRNCDRYDLTIAKAEYKKYRTEICLRESNPFIANDETLPFDEWLYAKAKGGAK